MFAQIKKGQVTLFIIVGLMLLLVMTTFLIWRNASVVPVTADSVNLNQEFIEVNQHIQYCLEESANDAVKINGLKGGLYNPSEYIFGDLKDKITAFYKEGQVVSPTKEQVAESIAFEFLRLMPDCLDTFEGIEENMEYDSSKAKITVRIVPNKIIFKGNYPITSQKEEKSITFSQLSHTVENVRLFTVLDLANELSFIQQTDREYICVSCALELADSNYMFIDYSDVGSNETLYTITDLLSSINGEPYKFLMAHEH